MSGIETGRETASAASLMLAERLVPRYTSYPTAPHFGPAVDGITYANWLSQLSSNASLSIYFHVPFCTELCHYCGCHTKATRRRGPVEAYSEHLIREIELVQSETQARKVDRIHWGGGTPSILGCERLSAVKQELARHFDLEGLREHAIELDPRYVTTELAECLAEIGINRASLGVQDLSAHVQQAIGRIQSFRTVAEASARLRDVGITRLNFDLMYGLPRQTVEDAARSAELAASLEPARMAVFPYAHVPWLKRHQRLITTHELPGLAVRLAQFNRVCAVLTAAGYRAIGLDHFARPDDDLAACAESRRLRRNFQGYTVDQSDALIGFGASAIGALPQGYVQNAHDVGGYERRIAGGQLATERGLQLSPEDRMRARIIECLMCDFAVDLPVIEAEWGIHSRRFESELDALSQLADLVQITDRRVTITSRGRPFARLIAAEFDTYLAAGRARHSQAV